MIDYLYRIVPFYRNWGGQILWGYLELKSFEELQAQWLINRKLECELVLNTMLEF